MLGFQARQGSRNMFLAFNASLNRQVHYQFLSKSNLIFQNMQHMSTTSRRPIRSISSSKSSLKSPTLKSIDTITKAKLARNAANENSTNQQEVEELAQFPFGVLAQLPNVPTVDELIDVGTARASRVRVAKHISGDKEKTKDLQIRKLMVFVEYALFRLQRCLSAVPKNLSQLHPYERTVVGLTLGPNVSPKQLNQDLQEYMRSHTNDDGIANPSSAPALHKLVFGGHTVSGERHFVRVMKEANQLNNRLSTYLQQQRTFIGRGKSLKEVDGLSKEAQSELFEILKSPKTHTTLENLRDMFKTLRKLNVVNPRMPTIALVGAPNVGKSSLVRFLSSGKPEVQNYPFTTRAVTVGHLAIQGITQDYKCQVTDTPGLLNRPDYRRKKMEMLTLAVLEHVPDLSVLFVIDPSGHCGTSLEDQLMIRQELRWRYHKLVPGHRWFDVATKSDIWKVDHSNEYIKSISNISGTSDSPSMDIPAEYEHVNIDDDKFQNRFPTKLDELKTRLKYSSNTIPPVHISASYTSDDQHPVPVLEEGVFDSILKHVPSIFHCIVTHPKQSYRMQIEHECLLFDKYTLIHGETILKVNVLEEKIKQLQRQIDELILDKATPNVDHITKISIDPDVSGTITNPFQRALNNNVIQSSYLNKTNPHEFFHADLDVDLDLDPNNDISLFSSSYDDDLIRKAFDRQFIPQNAGLTSYTKNPYVSNIIKDTIVAFPETNSLGYTEFNDVDYSTQSVMKAFSVPYTYSHRQHTSKDRLFHQFVKDNDINMSDIDTELEEMFQAPLRQYYSSEMRSDSLKAAHHENELAIPYVQTDSATSDLDSYLQSELIKKFSQRNNAQSDVTFDHQDISQNHSTGLLGTGSLSSDRQDFGNIINFLDNTDDFDEYSLSNDNIDYNLEMMEDFTCGK